MTEVLDDTAGLVARAAEELGGGREAAAPYSPVKTVERAKRPASKEKSRSDAKKAKKSPDGKNHEAGKSRGKSGYSVVTNETSVVLNSQEFPDPETRPVMFRDDWLFIRLPFEHAARVMWEYAQSEEKKKEQQKKKKDHEKSDDKLPLLNIPEGKDDGCTLISEARKMLARPVNKEIKDQMSWLPIAHKEIVRNLPLRTVGLEDCVLTSAVEACHDLSSKIEIKNFSPTNLRSSASSKKQTASYEEGKLVVASEDVYGELETIYDVVQAFVTLSCIWQKLHPHWPVANIGLKVCFAMKLFAHCEGEARKVMIEWANRYLQANASRAASKDGCMSYERAYSLAGKVCMDHVFPKEPPAKKGHTAVTSSTVSASPRIRPEHCSSKVRGGQGGAAEAKRTHFGTVLSSGLASCKFWNMGTCRTQTASSCTRDGKEYEHSCDVRKGAGLCQGDHMRGDHV